MPVPVVALRPFLAAGGCVAGCGWLWVAAGGCVAGCRFADVQLTAPLHCVVAWLHRPWLQPPDPALLDILDVLGILVWDVCVTCERTVLTAAFFALWRLRCSSAQHAQRSTGVFSLLLGRTRLRVLFDAAANIRRPETSPCTRPATSSIWCPGMAA